MIDLVPFFGDLSQSEKRSEIKPPLVVLGCTLGKMQLSYGHKKYHYYPVQNVNVILGIIRYRTIFLKRSAQGLVF